MKRSTLEIYCLFVSFITLGLMVFHLGKSLNDLYYFVNPLASFDPIQLEYFQSNEKYFSSLKLSENLDINSDAVTSARLEDFEKAKKLNAHIALQGIRHWFLFFILELAIYLFHWKLAGRLHDKNT